MSLLAVSSRAEVAVLLGARSIWHRSFIGTLARLPLGGGAPRGPALAYRRAEIPCRLDRVFLDTGRREPFAEVAPPDRTGLLSPRDLAFTHDMRSYTYTAYYQVSSLFVSEPSEPR
jgi:hypothetical protein